MISQYHKSTAPNLYYISDISVKDARDFFWEMKDSVLKNTIPHDDQQLERSLERVFGNKTMTHYQIPKLLMTATVATQVPAKLHMFRNYNLQGQSMGNSCICICQT